MDLTAKFVSNVIIGNAPLEVAFTNTSSGPFTRVEWDFGDGNKSTEINPVHVFSSNGNFVVTLTIYNADATTAVFTQTITVLSKQFVEGLDDATQQALFTFKRFDPGQVSVKKVTTTGSTFESNSPLYDNTTFDVNDVNNLVFSAAVEHTSFSGGNTILYHPFASVNDFLGRASDITMAVVLCPTGTTSGSSTEWNDVFKGTGQTASIANKPPVLFYKVTAVNTGNTLLTVDRELLTMQDDASGRMYAYFFGVCGSTVAYGSGLTSGSNMNVGIDIGVDSAEQLTFEGIGWLSGETRKVRGFAAYIGYTGSSGASFAVVYPEHTGASTVNRWYPGNTHLTIPWILWHENSNSAGLRLFDLADPTQRDVETGLRFRYLRAGTTQNDTIVGQVFHDKKLILITDPEIVAAAMFTNDRSWTLPAPTVKHVSSSGSWVSGGTNPTGVSWYFTYRVVERNPVDGSWPTTALGSDYLGYAESNAGLPCQYIQRVDVPSGSAGVGYFNITIPKLNLATGGTNCVANDTRGFVASWVELMCATGATTASGPDMSSWHIMTGAPVDAAWTGNFATSNVITVNNDSSFRRDLSGETYSWASTVLSGSSGSYIGTETSLIATLSGNYASDIYKMSAVCVARNNEFNNTQNMTFDESNNDYTYVSEVGLYNESNELLMVGKLSRPIKKNDQKFITIKLELDL